MRKSVNEGKRKFVLVGQLVLWATSADRERVDRKGICLKRNNVSSCAKRLNPELHWNNLISSDWACLTVSLLSKHDTHFASLWQFLPWPQLSSHSALPNYPKSTLKHRNVEAFSQQECKWVEATPPMRKTAFDIIMWCWLGRANAEQRSSRLEPASTLTRCSSYLSSDGTAETTWGNADAY